MAQVGLPPLCQSSIDSAIHAAAAAGGYGLGMCSKNSDTAGSSASATTAVASASTSVRSRSRRVVSSGWTAGRRVIAALTAADGRRRSPAGWRSR